MPIGTILMAMYGQGKTRGQVAILGIEATTNQANANIVVHNGVNNYFVYHQLVKNYLTTRASANEGGQANLSLGIVKELQISFTENQAEQIAIGTFFRTLDNIIAATQRQITLLKQLKAAYLQQMFPQAGERVPRVRFGGFSGDWEEMKLGEIADIIGGGTPDTSITEYWSGEIDWYSPVEIGEQIYVDGSQKKITKLGLQKSSAKVLPVGTVLFTSRAGIGNTAILKKEGATNQGFQSIVPCRDMLDTYFIFSRTNELKRFGETNGAGSTFIEVSGKQMSNMLIAVPTLQEQVTIGNFFCKLDTQIVSQSEKIDKLKQIKTAYLQKMFV